MGPKGKQPKGKSAPPTAPEIDPNDILTELQKEFFEFQLSDIEKKLTRIAEREEELTAGRVELEEKIEEFKKERGVVVAEKEQLLAMKEEEKCKKRDDMIFFADEIKNRIERHKKRIQELHQKFDEMVEEMTAQLETLEEEVRILEDYKQNKEVYSSELDNIQKEAIELDMQHQRNLFEINAKWEKAKVRMKKELQSRLLLLSIEFRKRSQKKIGNPCHRMVQENKAIQTTLLKMKEEILEYESRKTVSKKNVDHFQSRSGQMQEENRKMIARTIIQVYVIKTLEKNRLQLLEKLREFQAVDALNKTLIKKLTSITAEVDKKSNAIEDIKQDIDDKIEETNKMRQASWQLKKDSRRLHVLIRNALKVAEEALAVRLIPLGGMEEEKYLTMEAKINLFKKRRDVVFARKGRILQYLLEVLSKAQITDEERRLLKISTESIGLDEIRFSEIFGKLIVEESRDSLLRDQEEEEEEKGPMFFTSLTSLPRSVSELDIKTREKEEYESYEGEFEEYGEGYEEEESEKAEKEEEAVKKEVPEEGQETEGEEEEDESQQEEQEPEVPEEN